MKFVLRTSEVKFALTSPSGETSLTKGTSLSKITSLARKGKLSFSVFSVKDNTPRGVPFLFFAKKASLCTREAVSKSWAISPLSSVFDQNGRFFEG